MPKDTPERPDDLITASEAATIAGKKKATIRSWVRKKKITGYREDPANNTSSLMVSKSELRVYLVTNGTITHENNKGRPETISVSVKEKEEEIDRLKKELETYKEKCKLTEQRVCDLQTFNDTLQGMLQARESEVNSLNRQLQSVMELQGKLQDDYKQSQDDYRQILTYMSLPFWKRWTADVKLLKG